MKEQTSNQSSHQDQAPAESLKYRKKFSFIKKENARMKFYLYTAMVIFMLSLGANVIIYFHYHTISTEHSDLILARKKLTADYATLRDQYDDLSEQFNLVINPDVRIIQLDKVENGFDAIIYYNVKNGSVILNISTLPESESPSLFKLISFNDKGEQTDLGSFEGGARVSVLRIMSNSLAAKGFQLFEETADGSILRAEWQQ